MFSGGTTKPAIGYFWPEHSRSVDSNVTLRFLMSCLFHFFLIFVSFSPPYRFGASTIRYASFFTVGAVLAELGTNKLTDALWESNNAGKTYGSVDWSKFDPQEESEGGEEEDEEDEDDDE
jgi:hypothetical protein